jgi:hypothetical protein
MVSLAYYQIFDNFSRIVCTIMMYFHENIHCNYVGVQWDDIRLWTDGNGKDVHYGGGQVGPRAQGNHQYYM